MKTETKQAFTLIELLIVIAVIAVMAAILFPVFAQAREKARMSACMSNMREIGLALTTYVQDYDETYPYVRFHGVGAQKGLRSYCWRNAIVPYLRSLDVMACPSNPLSHPVVGQPNADLHQMRPGDNAEGWETESERRMPVSYAINSFTSSYYPADTPEGKRTPPLRLAQVPRPADTIIVCETNWGVVDTEPFNLWGTCGAVFAHQAGKLGNFVFYDGHAKSRKWLQTLYPLSENQWELSPNPEPNNRLLTSPADRYAAPDSPAAASFQQPACLSYQ